MLPSPPVNPTPTLTVQGTHPFPSGLRYCDPCRCQRPDGPGWWVAFHAVPMFRFVEPLNCCPLHAAGGVENT